MGQRALGHSMRPKAKLTRQTSRTGELFRKIHDTAHAAFWALAVACSMWFVINFPRIVDARAVIVRERLQEISAENRLYCEKWGMKAGTHEHTLCTLDLQGIREREGARIANDLTW